MTFLLVCKQKKNVDTFEGVIAALLALGQRVVLTIQERDAARDARLAEQFAHPGFSIVPCPDGRTDGWRTAAPLVRTVRDWAQYMRPAYAPAAKLAERAGGRLARELAVPAGLVGRPPTLPAQAAARAVDACARVERAIPRDPMYDEFLSAHAPDVVLVTPGLHFGSGQADIVKSAQALGLPSWMLLFSWDNLSTKGALHVPPDLMFVWNERQRQEAQELHDFPPDRVVVAGAPRFDAFFELRSRASRSQFFQPLGLDATRPTLLYLCSSRFIAEDEPAFIRSWLKALRTAGGRLGSANVIVRPHPDVPLESGVDPETVTWRQMPNVTGWVHRPFEDPAAIVLRTTYRTQEAFFECLHHADAVVALNTSAELEAGIAGRPVFTVLATDRAADGQAHTLHFNYLLREYGGFVTYAASLPEHVAQLEGALREPTAGGDIQRFVKDFLRPHGDEAVSSLLARLLVDRAVRRPVAPRPEDPPTVAGSSPPPPSSTSSANDAPAVLQDHPVPVRLLRLTADSPASVFATPETRRWRRDGVVVMAPGVRAWLDAQVRPGDTVYEVGAGVGVYAIFAAVHRGCTVVAFEPGFAAFKALCDNVVHNGCGRSVLPLPVALGPRTGLLELEYSHDAGSEQHSLTDRPWRAARDGSDVRYVQPVCADTLDDVVRRHALPPPTAIRIAVRRQPQRVLQGAAAVLALPGLRTVLCSMRSREQADALAALVEPLGFSGGETAQDGDHGISVVFTRVAPTQGRGRAFRRLGALFGTPGPT